MNILGIGGLLGHDANAALIVNGKIIAAAQEERFSGIKHDADYPSRAIADCLQAGNISAKEVDVVVLSEKPLQVYVYNQFGRPSGRFFNKLAQRSFLHKKALSPYEQQITKQFPNATLKYAWHHFSHAVSSFYSTNFEEAAFLCIDGKGEYANASIGYINNKKAVITHELPYANGLGMLYTVITHFLGFPSFGSEYKVMGLAPYGKPVFADKIRKLYKELDGGAIVLLKNKGFHPADIKKLFPWISSILEIDPRALQKHCRKCMQMSPQASSSFSNRSC